MKTLHTHHFRKYTQVLLPMFILLLSSIITKAQVTTSTIAGYVNDSKKESIIGATVKAIHLPSGTVYGAVTNDAGRFTISGVRVGGPFKVSVTYIGFADQSLENIYTNLGTTTNVNFIMQETGVALEEVSIVSKRHDIFSSERTGAATTFDRTLVNAIPTIGSRSINDITKYNPNGNGRSFGGQDSRSNNFTIDGSVFNNGFGLGSDASAGGRTGSTAISLDAIEEVQVNVAPYDVRQTGFVGSGINAVTRSGTNEFSGSAYYNWRNANLYGNKAKGTTVTTTPFNENVYGVRIGGPIIKNKLFFFADGEFIRRTDPATPWVASGSKNIGQVTRVTVADLDLVSNLLKDKFGYITGPYEAYNLNTKSDKFLIRLDYNINERNKLTLRYTNHNSQSDQLISNSSSDGAGNRRTLFTAMSYKNSGYIIGDNTRSIVGELNSTIGNKMSNEFTAGYDYQNEDRQYLYSSKFKGGLFPTIDILKDKVDYISAGMDPFTPNNLLNYGTFHVTDNISYYLGKHTITGGINLERFKSNNSFFDGSNAVYQFNTIEDFQAAANGDSAAIFKFQYRYSALPGGAIPYQVLYANKYDVYVQDAMQLNNNFKLTFGIRASVVDLGDTKVLENAALKDSVFLNLDNQPTKFNTAVLPNSKLLLEPRLGFNWDINGNKSTQIRGGIGIFTGRPPYVYLSNQIGNNGVLTGFIEESNTNTKKYPLVGDPSIFIPEKPTLPSTFSIAVTDKNYKYPQVFKTNVAIDQKLPWGLVATAEFMYNKNMNAVLYYDANLEPATATFAGPDTRPRFPGSFSASSKVIRRVDNVSRFAVLTNTDEGYYYGATFKLEYPYNHGFYGMLAYTYSEAKDLMSASSIASGSYTSARSVDGNNKLKLAYADNDVPHRVVGLLSYREEFKNGAIQFTLGYEGRQGGDSYAFPSNGRYSYTYNGDMNGDGISGNDLLFVPKAASDLKFIDLTVGSVTYTAAQQADLFEKYINQDTYLKGKRGQYTERNGGIMPFVHRFDLSVSKDFKVMAGTSKNTLQVRVDILNFGNMLNSDWGVTKRVLGSSPLVAKGADASGTPQYQVASQLLNESTNKTILDSATISDVWSLQFGVRYSFN